MVSRFPWLYLHYFWFLFLGSLENSESWRQERVRFASLLQKPQAKFLLNFGTIKACLVFGQWAALFRADEGLPVSASLSSLGKGSAQGLAVFSSTTPADSFFHLWLWLKQPRQRDWLLEAGWLIVNFLTQILQVVLIILWSYSCPAHQNYQQLTGDRTLAWRSVRHTMGLSLDTLLKCNSKLESSLTTSLSCQGYFVSTDLIFLI